MKSAKKLLALILAVIMVLGLVACVQDTPNPSDTQGTNPSGSTGTADSTGGTEAPKDPVTLEWWYRGNGPQEDTEKVEAAFNELLKTYPGMEHVTVNFNCYDAANYAQAVTLAQSSNQTIDILNTVGLNFATEVQNGTYLPLDDLLSDTMKAELPEWLWDLGSIDGKVYIVPNYQRAANMNYMIVPKAYMDKYGDLAEFKKLLNSGKWTVEEFAALQEKFVKAVQAGEGATHYAVPIGHSMINANYMMGWHDSIFGNYISPEASDTVVHKYMTEDAKKGFEIAARWYEEGLIHPEANSIKYADFTGKNLLNDVSFCYYFVNGAGPEEEIAATHSAQYGFDVYAIALSDHYFIKNSWGAGGNGVYAKSENPEEAMRLIELLNTEEGQKLYNMVVYGLEGEHWEWVDDTHIKTLEYSGTQGGSDTTYAAMKWIIGNTFYAYLNQGCIDGENEIALKIGEEGTPSNLAGFIPVTKDLVDYNTQVNAVTTEYASTLESGVMGADWEDTYNAFVEKMKNAGDSKIVESLQNQMNTFLKK